MQMTLIAHADALQYPCGASVAWIALADDAVQPTPAEAAAIPWLMRLRNAGSSVGWPGRFSTANQILAAPVIWLRWCVVHDRHCSLPRTLPLKKVNFLREL